MTEDQKSFLRKAIDLSLEGMHKGKGGPFGCIIVKDGKIVGSASNHVISNTDPTAHAEVEAIRDACKNLNTFQLTGCELYTSCEPCPMCLGAIYWARPDRVFYANTKEDAADAGFDDQFIYEELPLDPSQRQIPMVNHKIAGAKEAFEEWKLKEDKTPY
ncbi:tRNA-specific adenosine deaminase [Echinicola pacifica]|uniref:tRNA-specific adenosine deaminase n=1 Tax=Echinicola pacifica TaxID=346377 RepID=A0A918Q1W7_9BACT|nr:nucleoside deaminase [Echinicola pacifica]GGZ30983.1 tRNA-specific adenosine deaminase [Echinicola pacifica]